MTGFPWIAAGLVHLLAITSARAQVTCENYGSPINSSACACPPGFGGSTCSAPACGGNIFQAQQRPLVSNASATSFGNVSASACACPSGWTGTGCNVCQASTVCQSAFTAVGGNTTESQQQDALNTTLTCNTSPRVWAAGEMSCTVLVRDPPLPLSLRVPTRHIEPHPPKRVSPLIKSDHSPHFEHILDASTQFHLLRSIEFRLCPIMVRRHRTILLRRESMLADRPKVKRCCNLVMFRPSMHMSSWCSFLRRRGKLKFDQHYQSAQRKPNGCLRCACRQRDRVM